MRDLDHEVYRKIKWPEVIIYFNEYWPSQLNELVEWIKQNIEGYNKHCIFCTDYLSGYVGFKFRHEKDLIWFKMVWQ